MTGYNLIIGSDFVRTMRFPFFITFFVLYTGVLEKAQNYITAKINTILKVKFQNEIAIDNALSREGLS